MTEGTISEAASPLEGLLLPVLPAAYGTALRLTRNAADAEDLVQEAAFQACRGFSTFVPGSNSMPASLLARVHTAMERAASS